MILFLLVAAWFAMLVFLGWCVFSGDVKFVVEDEDEDGGDK